MSQERRSIVRSRQLKDFTCRSAEQTEWLLRHARQCAAAGSTRVFVTTPILNFLSCSLFFFGA